jgi:hypothetical protein
MLHEPRREEGIPYRYHNMTFLIPRVLLPASRRVMPRQRVRARVRACVRARVRVRFTGMRMTDVM